MTSIDSAHGILHDPVARKSFFRRIEMLVIVFVMSGGWAGVGYGFGVKADSDKYERLRTQYNDRIAAVRKEKDAEITRLTDAYSRGLGDVAKDVARSAGATADATKALADVTKDTKPKGAK